MGLGAIFGVTDLEDKDTLGVTDLTKLSPLVPLFHPFSYWAFFGEAKLA